VVNHDLPRSADAYTHRIGRVGRLQQNRGLATQQPAVAVSFVLADAPGSEAHFRLIEKRQQQRVPREQVPGFEAVGLVVAEAPASETDTANAETAGLVDNNGGVKGRRPSKKDKLRAAASAAAVLPAVMPAGMPTVMPAGVPVVMPAGMPVVKHATAKAPAPQSAAPAPPAPPRPDSRNVADVMAEWRERNPR
jgi:superfamily II DNA/RNA helicase